MPTIEFQAEGHIYTVDGIVKPSVTQVLAEMGLANYYNIDPWYMERGKAVHSGTVMIDAGTLNWDKVDKRILGYLEAYKSFIGQSGLVFEHKEKKLYSEKYDFCGTPDRFPPLLDIKTGQSFPYQLELYGTLLRENGYITGTKAYTLNLKENGKYSLDTYKFNRTNRGIALDAVYNYNKRRNNGLNTKEPRD